MKLYLITQDANNEHDTYDSAVVCAESEEEAQKIDPSGDGGEFCDFGNYRTCSTWVLALKDVKVKYLGEADPSLPRGVVCASFRAG